MNINEFKSLLLELNQSPYGKFRQLKGITVLFENSVSLQFKHIQGSTGANPASMCVLYLGKKFFEVPSWAVKSSGRKLGSADYILRLFNSAVEKTVKQNRGVDGSGSFVLISMPQQILERNVVEFSSNTLAISFRVSLPGDRRNLILGNDAAKMFAVELPAIIEALMQGLCQIDNWIKQCEAVEDVLAVQDILEQEKLMAFIADGSILPRESGISDKPACLDVIPFKSPENLAGYIDFPNAGKLRGLCVKKGVTVLIGGGFHGKSTFLNALAKGVYPHIIGDGREKIVTCKSAVSISAEDGRSIQGLDISPFISNLPNGKDSKRFYTDNASGSTSQAAAIMESILAGANFLLVDEDSSATNFLIRDSNMRSLIPEDPITPFFDRVRELYDNYSISTLIIAGGSSDYLGVADNIIAMRSYLPENMTKQAKKLNLPEAKKPIKPFEINDLRLIDNQNFDPSYQNLRMNKSIPFRVKPLRQQEDNILEYGKDLLDLNNLTGLVDAGQTLAIGYILYLARCKVLKDSPMTLSNLANEISKILEQKGLKELQLEKAIPQFFSKPRIIEIVGAINRLRSLGVKFP